MLCFCPVDSAVELFHEKTLQLNDIWQKAEGTEIVFLKRRRKEMTIISKYCITSIGIRHTKLHGLLKRV